MSGEARREQVTAPRVFRISSHAADLLDDDKSRIYHGRVILGDGPSPARAFLLHPSLAVCVCVRPRALFRHVRSLSFSRLRPAPHAHRKGVLAVRVWARVKE